MHNFVLPGDQPQSRFPLGDIFITTAASEALTQADITVAMLRHSRGDWGAVCSEDWSSNELSLTDGSRLLSVYHGTTGVKFWIITEADRSVTTVLLPADY